MAKVNLEEMVGGGLQEVFAKAMEEVVENMQNPNTPYKNKREIAISMEIPFVDRWNLNQAPRIRRNL